jgi:hypothetical protein
MPLSIFRVPPRETFQISNASQDITPFWVGKYGYMSPTIDRTLTLDLADISAENFEIDIRVDANAAATATVIIVGGTLNVTSDLGPTIPPGGIAELKRRGNSTVVDMYGYIEP